MCTRSDGGGYGDVGSSGHWARGSRQRSAAGVLVLLLAVSIGLVGMEEDMHGGRVVQQGVQRGDGRHWHYCFSVPSGGAILSAGPFTPSASPGLPSPIRDELINVGERFPRILIKFVPP